MLHGDALSVSRARCPRASCSSASCAERSARCLARSRSRASSAVASGGALRRLPGRCARLQSGRGLRQPSWPHRWHEALLRTLLQLPRAQFSAVLLAPCSCAGCSCASRAPSPRRPWRSAPAPAPRQTGRRAFAPVCSTALSSLFPAAQLRHPSQCEEAMAASAGSAGSSSLTHTNSAAVITPRDGLIDVRMSPAGDRGAETPDVALIAACAYFPRPPRSSSLRSRTMEHRQPWRCGSGHRHH